MASGDAVAVAVAVSFGVLVAVGVGVAVELWPPKTLVLRLECPTERPAASSEAVTTPGADHGRQQPGRDPELPRELALLGLGRAQAERIVVGATPAAYPLGAFAARADAGGLLGPQRGTGRAAAR